jgi:hypothetical protein
MFSGKVNSTTQVISPKNGQAPDYQPQCRGLVLLVDEAHTLPLKLLDELRMLTNLARAGQPLVRVILSGSCALEERLANPKLDSFNSRIATRCYLEAFNRTETAEYLRAKIALTGGNGEEIFTDDACQSVYRATEGVPRLINQLCDHALLVAFSAGRRLLEAAHIEDAWADLQQLPTPWNGDSQGDSQGEKPGVIEFGRLDDMPEEASAESIKMPTPTLKLNTEMDESDLELAEPVEPAEQIDSIKQLITGAEDDFEPSPSIEPEIELSFEEFEHPFQEPFEQEEIVSDRYAAPTSALSVLQSVVPVFQFGTLEETLVVQEKVREQEFEESPDVQVEVQEYSVAEPPVAQENVLRQKFAESLGIQEIVLEETTETLPYHRNTVTAMIEPEDSRVLSVGEDRPVEETPSLRPVRPVRRNEYGRLFVKLRQG